MYVVDRASALKTLLSVMDQNELHVALEKGLIVEVGGKKFLYLNNEEAIPLDSISAISYDPATGQLSISCATKLRNGVDSRFVDSIALLFGFLGKEYK